jgi:hypothetical protein
MISVSWSSPARSSAASRGGTDLHLISQIRHLAQPSRAVERFTRFADPGRLRFLTADKEDGVLPLPVLRRIMQQPP